MSGTPFKFLLLWTFLALGGCSEPASTSNPNPEPEPEQAKKIVVKLDAEFRLPIHETATVDGHGLDLEFDDVTEDTRCPIGDRCIWAGQVSMRVSLTRGEESLGDVKLTSRVGEHDSTDGKVDGFSIRLISLEPYPESGKQVPKTDYVATLMVSQGE